MTVIRIIGLIVIFGYFIRNMQEKKKDIPLLILLGLSACMILFSMFQ